LYLIGSDGFSNSHSHKEFNSVVIPFVFGQGDTIFIEYDFVLNKLKFIKSNNQFIELPMIAPPLDNAYHPCVALYGQNDSVELIEWK